MKETRGLLFQVAQWVALETPTLPSLPCPSEPPRTHSPEVSLAADHSTQLRWCLPVPKLHLPVLVGVSVSPATSPAWVKIFYRNTVPSFDYQTTKQGTP